MNYQLLYLIKGGIHNLGQTERRYFAIPILTFYEFIIVKYQQCIYGTDSESFF